MPKTRRTAERTDPERIKDLAEYFILLRNHKAYDFYRRFLNKEARVLDIGCGRGYGTTFLARFAKKVIGLDVNPSTINDIKKKYHQYHNLNFLYYDGKKIPFAQNSFDLVVANQTIEHICPPAAWLTEIKRVLRPGGYFLAATPNRAWRVADHEKPWNPFHCQEYDASELKKLLESIFPSVTILALQIPPAMFSIDYKRIAWIRYHQWQKKMGRKIILPRASRLIRLGRWLLKPARPIYWRLRYRPRALAISRQGLGIAADLIGCARK